MTLPRHPRTFLPALALAALLAACHRGGGKASPAQSGGAPPAPDAQAEATRLGGEIFELVDRAADYRASHRGRPPVSLRQLGVDSLTPETLRAIAADSAHFTVSVGYRRPAGRALQQCSGTDVVLEEASLNGGRFHLSCVTSAGSTGTFEVARAER